MKALGFSRDGFCLFEDGFLEAEEWRRVRFWIGNICCRRFRNMIPTKMLVYRGPDGGTYTDTVPNTTNATRRKKSTGELFHNGYRVRMGHGQVHDKEDQDSFCFSLGGCFHLISYWGKSCRTKKKKRGISRFRLVCPDWFRLFVSAGAGSGSGSWSFSSQCNKSWKAVLRRQTAAYFILCLKKGLFTF